jgi:hypothetical protein
VSVCRMFNCAAAGRPKPKYLSTDHDPLFRFHRWLANLRVSRPPLARWHDARATRRRILSCSCLA